VSKHERTGANRPVSGIKLEGKYSYHFPENNLPDSETLECGMRRKRFRKIQLCVPERTHSGLLEKLQNIEHKLKYNQEIITQDAQNMQISSRMKEQKPLNSVRVQKYLVQQDENLIIKYVVFIVLAFQ
jgi:hypothetical protein